MHRQAVAPSSDLPEPVGDLLELARRSIEIIGAHQDPGGAYPASPTFSAYRGYAWLRDGSFTAEAMSRWGEVASADRFHDWVAGVLLARRHRVGGLVAAAERGDRPARHDMLPTRFTLDGEEGSDEWWDFQTDGYGMWLWAVATHVARHALSPERWLPAVGVAVDYLVAFGGDACFDWWEEHDEHQHVSTLAAVYGGLIAAQRMQTLDDHRREAARSAASGLRRLVLAHGTVGDDANEHLVKWLGTSAVDGSLPACIVPFGLIEPGTAIATATLTAVSGALEVNGGVHRFAADVFYGGGQWPLLSCLLGWNLAVAGDVAGAWRLLRWSAATAIATGELPEQVADHLVHPGHRTEWMDRWGPVATPLLWSHAMFLILADELGLRERLAEA